MYSNPEIIIRDTSDAINTEDETAHGRTRVFSNRGHERVAGLAAGGGTVARSDRSLSIGSRTPSRVTCSIHLVGSLGLAVGQSRPVGESADQ